jgi:sugar lactone lactonase YvrE
MQGMKLSWVVWLGALVAACGPVEKQKNPDPTVIAEDLDQPVDLTVTPRGAYWTTQPSGVSFGGSGKPSSLQFVPVDGGDVQDVLTTLVRATALTNDGTHLYWFDTQSTGKQRLSRMDFDAVERTTLVDFGDQPESAPTADTRIIPFKGRLYWGGATHLWAMSLDGGAPQKLVRARMNAGGFIAVLVDESGVYFMERNSTLGRDFKRVGLDGQGYEPEPPDAGPMDAGSIDAGSDDAGMSDAGLADAGMTAGDGGSGWPEEAPGVTLLRRGIAWSGARGVAIRDPWLYWFNTGLLGGTLVRAPLLGGDEDDVLNLPGNTSPTDLASDGKDLVFLLSSNAGGGLYRVEKNERQELYRLGLLNGGTPRVLRLDETSAWFFAGGDRGARLHRVSRVPAADAGVDAGVDAGLDGGADGGP